MSASATQDGHNKLNVISTFPSDDKSYEYFLSRQMARL